MHALGAKVQVPYNSVVPQFRDPQDAQELRWIS
jgi:hypothetical protein